MKKFTVLILVLAIALCVCTYAVAENEVLTAETTKSQFEKALLQNGSVLIKEYKTCSSIKTNETNRDILIQTAVITDIVTESKYYALRMEHKYYNSKYDNGTSTGVLDADEVDNVIATLKYIKDSISDYSNDYTEMVYTSNDDLRIGAYSKNNEGYVFIKFSSYDTVYIKINSIDDIISGFKTAQNALQALQS